MLPRASVWNTTETIPSSHTGGSSSASAAALAGVLLRTTGNRFHTFSRRRRPKTLWTRRDSQTTTRCRSHSFAWNLHTAVVQASEICESHILNRRPERRLRGFALTQLAAPWQENSKELASRILTRRRQTHHRHYRTRLFQPGESTARLDTCKGSEPLSEPNAISP